MSPISRKPKYPYADTALVKFLAKRIDALKPDMTQREIAHRLGYDCINMVSMMKIGATKVPLEKIPALAQILKVDPIHLLRLGLGQHWPELGAVLAALPTPVTKNERAILSLIRDVTDNADPDVTAEQEADLVRILSPRRRTMLRVIHG